MKQRILNILICLDQLVFSILTLGSSYPDETISAAAYRLELDDKIQGKVFRPLIDLIFFFDKEHCKESYWSEIRGRQLPKTYAKQRE